MRKSVFVVLSLLLVLGCVSTSLADYAPSLASDVLDREYVYEGEDIFAEVVFSEEDLSEEYLCRSIRELVKEEIGEGESIDEISMDNDAVLKIVLSYEPGSMMADPDMYIYIVQSRFSSISEAILARAELDPFWEKIKFVYPTGEAVFSKDEAVNSEYGRYYENVEERIK